MIDIIKAIDPEFQRVTPIQGRGRSCSVAYRHSGGRNAAFVSFSRALAEELGFTESKNYVEIGYSPSAGVLIVANANTLPQDNTGTAGRYLLNDRQGTKVLCFPPPWMDREKMKSQRASICPFSVLTKEYGALVVPFIEVELPDWLAPGRAARQRGAEAAAEARRKFEEGQKLRRIA